MGLSGQGGSQSNGAASPPAPNSQGEDLVLLDEGQRAVGFGREGVEHAIERVRLVQEQTNASAAV